MGNRDAGVRVSSESDQMKRRSFIAKIGIAIAAVFLPRTTKAKDPLSLPVGYIVRHPVEPHLRIMSDQGLITCDGRSIKKLEYPELYSVLNNAYGSRRVGEINIPSADQFTAKIIGFK